MKTALAGLIAAIIAVPAIAAGQEVTTESSTPDASAAVTCDVEHSRALVRRATAAKRWRRGIHVGLLRQAECPGRAFVKQRKREFKSVALQRFARCEPRDCQLYARRLVSGIQFRCLRALFGRESGWRRFAANPTSSAHGIPQALPGSKMGPGWEWNAIVQINWGLDYIEDRYGSPCSANSFQAANGWY